MFPNSPWLPVQGAFQMSVRTLSQFLSAASPNGPNRSADQAQPHQHQRPGAGFGNRRGDEAAAVEGADDLALVVDVAGEGLAAPGVIQGGVDPTALHEAMCGRVVPEPSDDLARVVDAGGEGPKSR